MSRGFSFIELIIVIALMSGVMAFSVVLGIDSIERSSVVEERDLFVSLLLTGARAQAMANVGETAHGIHIDTINHEYILFNGTTYVAGASGNRVTPFSNTNLSITHSSGNTDIVFEALSGNVSTGAGTITLRGANAIQEIEINESGRINW
jgi:prepilin-type N-terminal cleavage/methylation domain-containing protein